MSKSRAQRVRRPPAVLTAEPDHETRKVAVSIDIDGRATRYSLPLHDALGLADRLDCAVREVVTQALWA